jgi:aspartate kinase
MKICKFGGSSLANATQFAKIKAIIEEDHERRIVVVSAVGKEIQTQNKITDLLYLLHAHLLYGVDYQVLLNEIVERYVSIQKELNLSFDVSGYFNQVKTQLNAKYELDKLVSMGEKLSAILCAEYLGWPMIDAKDAIVMCNDGTVDLKLTSQKIHTLAQQYPRFVIPGFYGALPNGRIKLMKRGGSDITGSIVAAALNADIYENWTDVSGIMMADPRIVPEAKPISELTYGELREMTFMGASVLHEESIQAVKHLNIPLNIRNTNDMHHPGTMIRNDIEEDTQSKGFITGITGLKDFAVVTVHKEQIARQSHVIRQILEIFDSFDLLIDHMSKGIDSLSLTVKVELLKEHQFDLFADLKLKCEIDKLTFEDDLALIAVVGRNMKDKPGVSGQLFSALGENKINIRLIAQGTDEISIIVGVSNGDFENTIRTLYERFIRL